jgi:hypothetical protein
MKVGLSLQRSEIFIDDALNPINWRSSGAQCFHLGRETALCFAPLERGKSFGARSFYKHLAPNGAKSNNVLLHFQVESIIHDLQELIELRVAAVV